MKCRNIQIPFDFIICASVLVSNSTEKCKARKVTNLRMWANVFYMGAFDTCKRFWPSMPVNKKYIKWHLCFSLALISMLLQQHRASVKYAELDQYKHISRKCLHQLQCAMNVVLNLKGLFCLWVFVAYIQPGTLTIIVVAQLQKYHFGSRQSLLCIWVGLLTWVLQHMNTGILHPGSSSLEAALLLL